MLMEEKGKRKSESDVKGLSINYVIADRGGGVSPKDYSIT